MVKDLLKKYKNIHFIGIGGIGQSALAGILLEQGFAVSGSDLKTSAITDRLKAMGARVYQGHSAENARNADLVIYSSAVSKDCPEMQFAKKANIDSMKRGLLLALILNSKKGVAVSGSHGKTTTSALVSLMLDKNKFKPSFAVGAELKNFEGRNFESGASDYFVAESDESDGSFLYLQPEYAIVTNIDREHMDYYRDMRACLDAYKTFINSTKEGGCAVLGIDCRNVRDLSKSYKGRMLTYGITKEADFCAEDIKAQGLSSKFICRAGKKRLGEVFLPLPGAHNAVNSLACIALGMDLGIDFEDIARALKDYKGAGRRFDIKGNLRGIKVIEDYAHHPSEIKATIKAASQLGSKRLFGIFQPHRYTRTLDLKEEFGKSFNGLDEVIITDIYSASERPIRGVTGKLIYDEVRGSGFKNARFMPKEKILDYILPELKKDDSVLVLGAGDISELSGKILKGLENKKNV